MSRIKTIKILSIAAILLLLSIDCFAQRRNYGRLTYMRNNPLKRYPSVGLSLGANVLRGDYGSVSQEKTMPYAQLAIDHRFVKDWGYSFKVGGGLYESRYKYPHQLLDIQSVFFSGEFQAMWYLNRLFNLDLSTRFYPFLSGGIGMMHFNPKADWKDSKGNYYYPWPDGTFRSEEWLGFNDPETPILKRDGKFETTLDPNGKYSHLATIFPIGGGIKYFVSRQVEIVVGAKAYFTNTDHLDHLVGFDDYGVPSKFNKSNDVLVMGYITIFYNSGKFQQRRFSLPSRRILPSF